MACQFTLPLEPLSALTSRAAPDGAVVGPQRGVDVGVRVEQVLGLERGDTAAGGFANLGQFIKIICSHGPVIDRSFRASTAATPF